VKERLLRLTVCWNWQSKVTEMPIKTKVQEQDKSTVAETAERRENHDRNQ